MALIRGAQIAVLADGIQTNNLADGVLSADSPGRLKMATNFFLNPTVVADKFAASSIGLDRLAEAVIQADGGQAFTADQSMGGFKLTNLATPTAATDAANKSYVDALANGLDVKASVRLATTAALAANTAAGSGAGKTLTATANGALSVDSVTVVVADRILVKDESTGANNGIYVVTTVGSGGAPYVLTRATDFDSNAEVTAGAFTFTEEGTVNDNSGWVLTTNNPITVDTTALSFSQFSGAGSLIAGDGLTQSGNTFNVGAGAGITVDATNVNVDFETNAANISVISAAVATGTVGSGNKLAHANHVHGIVAASAVDVGTANSAGGGGTTTVAKSDHVHRAPKPSTVDKATVPSATSGNYSTTGLTITTTPALDGYVEVTVNGVSYTVGDGDRDDLVGTNDVDCYFSADGGTTAKTVALIAAADTLYWNSTHAGFALSTSDRVDFLYETFA